MRGRTLLPTPLVGLFDRHVQPHLDQMQHLPIEDPTRHRLHRLGVRDRIEVRGEIRVNDLRMTLLQQAVHLPDRDHPLWWQPICLRLSGQQPQHEPHGRQIQKAYYFGSQAQWHSGSQRSHWHPCSPASGRQGGGFASVGCGAAIWAESLPVAGK